MSFDGRVLLAGMLLVMCHWQNHVRVSSRQVCGFVWRGTARLIHEGPKSSSCRRWYFTVNGKEREQPMTIDTQIYLKPRLSTYTNRNMVRDKAYVCNQI